MQQDIAAAENPSENPRAVRGQAIGSELRRIYDDVAQEPVPKSYLELLRRIYDEAWIFPVIWVPEEKPKLWQRLNFRLREFSLSFGQKRPNR